jgi:uncharacterized protein YdaU (DUF1376 family)
MKEYWYPWSPARYRADTLHLTDQQDLAYRRLIDHYMETKLPIPNSEVAIARIVGMPQADVGQLIGTLLPFFKKGDDGHLHHKRCDAILSDQEERAARHREKSRAGGQAKARKYNNINGEPATGNASGMPNPATDITDKTDITDSGKAPAKKLNGALYFSLRKRADAGERLTDDEKSFLWKYEDEQLRLAAE